MNKARIMLLARRATLLVPILALVYLYSRFEVARLPQTGCSPLLRFSPGSALVVDKSPPSYAEDDAVFFLGLDGALYLGTVQERRSAGYWIVTDNPSCEGPSSERFGAIGEPSLRGRVLFALSPH